MEAVFPCKKLLVQWEGELTMTLIDILNCLFLQSRFPDGTEVTQ
jgi:hypothetical protein